MNLGLDLSTKSNHSFRRIAFVLGIIVTLPVAIQSNAQVCTLNFFSLDQRQGLSDNAVTAIVKDREGYMWFGTNNGLNRYDGSEIKRFFRGTDSTSLPENQVVNLFVSSRGELWVGLESEGICRFDSRTESFEWIRHLSKDPSLYDDSGYIKGIAEDSDSVIYVATYGGLYCLDPGAAEFTGLPFLHDGSPDTLLTYKGLLSSGIATITSDGKEGLWIAYEDLRLTHYSRRNGTYRHYSLQKFRRKGERTLIKSMLFYNGRLWLGALGPGLIEFDPKTGASSLTPQHENFNNIGQIRPSTEEGFLWLATGYGLVNYNTNSGDYCNFTYIRADSRSLANTANNCVFEDSSGLIWVGSINAGVNYAFRDKPFGHFIFGPDAYRTLSDDNISALLSDDEGNLWVGYMSGIIEFNDRREGRKTTVPISALNGDYGPGTIFDLFQDSRGRIYCASWLGGLQVFDRHSARFIPLTGSSETYAALLGSIDVRDIDEDNQGNLWLCVQGKGVYMLDKARKHLTRFEKVENDTTTLSSAWVFHLGIDDRGSIWVSSAWGVSRITPGSKNVRRYLNTGDRYSITDNNTRMIKKDNQGRIWIGSDYGLNLYDPKIDGFHRIDRSAGFPADQIRCMEQDDNGTYWTGTARGLVSFDMDWTTGQEPVIRDVRFYDKDDGLQSNNFSLNCSYRDEEGTLYFGGNKGIDFFDPDAIMPVALEPELRIKSFEVFGKTVYPGSPSGPPVNKQGTVLLNHRQNMVGFEFAALNYFDVEGNRYSYRLDPLQTGWIGVGNNRNIVFSNLNPGNYSLSLKVITDDGRENELEDAVSFFIKPPFWKTSWFRYLALLVLVGLILLVFGIYTAGLRRKKFQLERVVQSRTMELKVQSEQLARSNEELNVLNSMKDKFFSIIAHDLKNPFNTIIGFTDLLIKDYENYPDDKRREMIGYVHDSVTSAYSLLANLLHWSRSQTNRLQMRPSKLKVGEMVKSVTELIQPMLKRKNITFNDLTDEGMQVWADRELFGTILRNLISNAIKFTKPGGEITLKAEPDREGMICFIVSDNGVGMEKEVLQDVFRIDVPVRAKGTEGEEGTGLGLLLCKEFVEKMGGKIRVESTRGKGTSVFFTLPGKNLSGT